MPYLTIYIFLGLIAVGLNNAFLIIDTEFIIILTIIF